MFALFAIPVLAAQGSDWITALVASPAETKDFQVGQAKVRLVVHHETDITSPREGLTIFWLTFPQDGAEMLVESLIGDSARRGSVNSRLESSAIKSDIAVLTGGFAGQGCASEGLVIAAGDHGETSLARWIEKNRLILVGCSSPAGSADSLSSVPPASIRRSKSRTARYEMEFRASRSS